MPSWNKITVILVLLSASLAAADDFKTVDGKEYKDAVVTHVDPDGIVVKTKSGISKLYFQELPKDVQQRFSYDPQNASTFSAQQAAAYAAANQKGQQEQQEAAARQQNAAAAQGAQQLAAYNPGQSLQDSYMVLQQQENALLQQIREANKPGAAYWVGRREYHHPNPLHSDLPVLNAHLDDVQHEKNRVRHEIEKLENAQH